MRVLSMMAHPDDTEILVGGTLARLRAAGWEIGIATFTAGDCGSATLQREEIAAIRLAEARAAAACLDAWYGCTRLDDVEIFCNAENVRKAVELARAFAPDVVITHSPVDYMVDHEEASRLARSASFALAMPLYRTRAPSAARALGATPALYYADPIEGIDPMGRRILPHFYVDISDTLELKRRMLACHESQRAWLRSHHGVDEYLDRMTSWAEAYGREAGFRHAEGLRQNLGHGYPREPILQEALAPGLQFLASDADLKG
jgi:LmbE family N-acetylglucosaminyl deacetylase